MISLKNKIGVFAWQRLLLAIAGLLVIHLLRLAHESWGLLLNYYPKVKSVG